MTTAHIKDFLVEHTEAYGTWKDLAKSLLKAISDESVVAYWDELAELDLPTDEEVKKQMDEEEEDEEKEC